MTSKGFIWNHEWTDQAEKLADIEGMNAVFALMRAMSDYVENKTMPEDLTPVASLLFDTMRKDLDINREKYDAAVEQRRKAANARWSKQKDNAEECDRMRSHSPHAADADIERRKEIEDNYKVVIKTSGSEPSGTAPEPPVISIPLNDGSEWPVTAEMISEWSSLYPAVDVMQELRNMRGWSLENPTRRKTKTGVRRFIGSWLRGEQDKGPRQTSRSGTGQRRLTATEIAALPYVDPFGEIRGTS